MKKILMKYERPQSRASFCLKSTEQMNFIKLKSQIYIFCSTLFDLISCKTFQQPAFQLFNQHAVHGGEDIVQPEPHYSQLWKHHSLRYIQLHKSTFSKLGVTGNSWMSWNAWFVLARCCLRARIMADCILARLFRWGSELARIWTASNSKRANNRRLALV